MNKKTKNKPLSLRQKFIRMFMLIAVIMALITSVLFVSYQYVYVKYQEINNLKILAKVVSENAQAAILFKDKEAVNELLSSLKANYDIEQAAIILPDNTVFAKKSFHNTNANLNIEFNKLKKENIFYNWNGVKVLTPIELDNETLGYVLISSNLNDLHNAVYPG